MNESQVSWPQILDTLHEVMCRVKITEYDCGSDSGIRTPIPRPCQYFMRNPGRRVLGRVACGKDEIICDHGEEFAVRSPITCQAGFGARFGICALCYGRDSDTLALAPIGAEIGLAAVQALSMPRKAPLRARPVFLLGESPARQVCCRRSAGTVRYGSLYEGMELISGKDYLRLLDTEESARKFTLAIEESGELYELSHEAQILVFDGQMVRPGDPLFQIPDGPVPRYAVSAEEQRHVALLFEAMALGPPFVLSPIAGRLSITRSQQGYTRLKVDNDELGDEWTVSLDDNTKERFDSMLLDGCWINAGDVLVKGSFDVHQVQDILGPRVAAERLLFELQEDFEFRRMYVEDRHLELILAQMLMWCEVCDPGETTLIEGAILPSSELEKENERCLSEGRALALAKPRVLGITEVKDRLRFVA